MDFSKLSDADLQAISSGDMSKVSDEGLNLIAGNQPTQQLPPLGQQAALIPGQGTNQPTPKQPDYVEPSLSEKANAGISAAGGMLTGAISAIPASIYGVGKDIYQRTFGNGQAGVNNAGQYAEEAMQNPVTQSMLPKTQLGKEYLGKIGDVMSVLPPVVPELNMLKGATGALSLEKTRFANIPKIGGEVTPEMSMKQKVFIEGRKNGYVATPTSVTDTALGATAESISNKAKLTAQSSIKNSAARVNDIRTNDLGLPEGTQISPADLEMVREKAHESTTAILDAIPEIKTTQEFRDNANILLKKYPYLEENHPDISKGGTVSTKEAMDVVRYLRAKADEKLSVPVGKKISPESQKEGETAYDMANKIEDDISNQLSDKPELFKNFEDARKVTAQSYAVQAALNAANGQVSGLKLASMYDKNPDLFTGGLKRAAEHAKAFPNDNREIAVVGGHPPLSAWDFLVAGGTAAAGHPLVAAAELGGRTFLPKIAMSNFVQNRILKSPPNEVIRTQMDHPTLQSYKIDAANQAKLAQQKMLEANNAVGEVAGMERGKQMLAEAQAKTAAAELRKSTEQQALLEAGQMRGNNMIIDAKDRANAKILGIQAEAQALSNAGIARGNNMLRMLNKGQQQ